LEISATPTGPSSVNPTNLVPNIGPGGRRRRLAGGVVGLLAAAFLLAALIVFGAPRAWRLLVALPVWAGALGVLQHRGKT
jgi:hypothetical protein